MSWPENRLQYDAIGRDVIESLSSVYLQMDKVDLSIAEFQLEA